MQGVIPDVRGSDRGPLCQRDRVPVWPVDAGDNPSVAGRSAEHAHATDRFAREIVPFLTCFLQRARAG